MCLDIVGVVAYILLALKKLSQLQSTIGLPLFYREVLATKNYLAK